MDSQPPSGPPSGPLSGPPPPPGPPQAPADRAGGPPPPWWRSWRLAGLTAGLMAVALVLVFAFADQGRKGGEREVFLQAAATKGRDPFTPSVAKGGGASESPTAAGPTQTAPGQGVHSVEGSATGLYGGTRKKSSCDVGQLIDYLDSNPAKRRAWAGAEGINPASVPSYLRSLTPVLLRADTRVTNHGFRNGAATSYQSVLQSGTAVLVDSRGVPRVRCACGNPLLPPAAVSGKPAYSGASWPSFQPSKLVVVQPAPQPVTVIVLLDPFTLDWFSRKVGDTRAATDHRVPPPREDPLSWTKSPTSTETSPGEKTTPGKEETSPGEERTPGEEETSPDKKTTTPGEETTGPSSPPEKKTTSTAPSTDDPTTQPPSPAPEYPSTQPP